MKIRKCQKLAYTNVYLPSTGNPEPRIVWYKNGKEIKAKKNQNRIKIHWDHVEDVDILEIRDANEDDAGEYTVKAINAAGTTEVTVGVGVQVRESSEEEEKKVQVTVIASESESSETELSTEITSEEEPTPSQYAPDFEEKPQPTSVTLGDTIKLTCLVTGLDDLQYSLSMVRHGHTSHLVQCGQ